MERPAWPAPMIRVSMCWVVMSGPSLGGSGSSTTPRERTPVRHRETHASSSVGRMGIPTHPWSYRMAPGLRMPSGSRASLTRRVRAITSGPSWSGSAAFLARPTPCSPVIVPPSADRRVHHLVEGGPGPLLGASGSAGSNTMIGMGVAVAGVGDDRDLDVVVRGDRRDRGEQPGQQRDRRPDVLQQQRPRAPRWRGTPPAGPRRTARPPRGRRSRRPRWRRRPRRPSASPRPRSARAAPGASDCAISSAPARAVEAHRPVVLDRVDRRPGPSAPSSTGRSVAADRDDRVGRGGHRRERRHQRSSGRPAPAPAAGSPG